MMPSCNKQVKPNPLDYRSIHRPDRAPAPELIAAPELFPGIGVFFNGKRRAEGRPLRDLLSGADQP
jgi:hypothetical protein